MNKLDKYLEEINSGRHKDSMKFNDSPPNEDYYVPKSQYIALDKDFDFDPVIEKEPSKLKQFFKWALIFLAFVAGLYLFRIGFSENPQKTVEKDINWFKKGDILPTWTQQNIYNNVFILDKKRKFEVIQGAEACNYIKKNKKSLL